MNIQGSMNESKTEQEMRMDEQTTTTTETANPNNQNLTELTDFELKHFLWQVHLPHKGQFKFPACAGCEWYDLSAQAIADRSQISDSLYECEICKESWQPFYIKGSALLVTPPIDDDYYDPDRYFPPDIDDDDALFWESLGELMIKISKTPDIGHHYRSAWGRELIDSWLGFPFNELPSDITLIDTRDLRCCQCYSHKLRKLTPEEATNTKPIWRSSRLFVRAK
jgi:hypothetical protein